MAERVLVVDDEPDLLELVRFHLAQAGFEVETARDGRQGLEAIRRRDAGLQEDATAAWREAERLAKEIDAGRNAAEARSPTLRGG